MNTIKEIKLDNTNWIEVTITDENNETIHCESFGGNDEYTELLRQRCLEFGVELTEEHLAILAEQKGKRHIPTEDELAAIEVQKQLQIVQELKCAKTQALNTIVVTVNDKTFDGNETARTNMISAILSADLIGKTEETWKLADNSTVLVTLMELKQALALAVQEVGRIVKCTTIGELYND